MDGKKRYSPDKGLVENEKRKARRLKLSCVTAYSNLVIHIVSQLTVAVFALLIFIFRDRIGEDGFMLIPVFEVILQIMLAVSVVDLMYVTVLIAFGILKYDKLYRRNSILLNVIYYVLAALLPVFCWGVWSSHDFKPVVLMLVCVLQVVVIINSFVKEKYLRRFLLYRPKKEKKPKEKKKRGKKESDRYPEE